jgi:hypothetical protein
VYDFAQFVMLRQAGVADNRKDTLDVRVEQTLAQDALPDHARRSEENHFHLDRLLFFTKAHTRASAPVLAQREMEKRRSPLV